MLSYPLAPWPPGRFNSEWGSILVFESPGRTATPVPTHRSRRDIGCEKLEDEQIPSTPPGRPPTMGAMFRPCIDLHEGKVKQIVGGSLSEHSRDLRTNFVSERSSAWYADLYRRDALRGGHIIKLGQGNDEAARAALQAYPGGMQIGGGMSADNARQWLDAGASHVIVTSWVFRDGAIDEDRLQRLVTTVGRQHLVLDLSCRIKNGQYYVVTDRWQKFTNTILSADTLGRLSESCEEFLIHAVDVEGLCRGIDRDLVARLADWSPIPTTYAGGATSLQDLQDVTNLGRGRIDLTIGSALDIFGGTGVKYEAAVAFNKCQS